jgi:putative spermidine/putrescine transport system permease protein
MTSKYRIYLLFLPCLTISAAFFLLPMAYLLSLGAQGEKGMMAYVTILAEPRHFESLVYTLVLSIAVTAVTLAIATIAALFLDRHRFFGRQLLIALLTLPLAFPGVVIGFMIIMIAGRQGLVAQVSELVVGERYTFAYSIGGLFLGYLYFSLPRTILTLMAAAEKLDPHLAEAASSLGASQSRLLFDVILPALKPAMIASGALCFATSMGAFGTAFTLATRVSVLPMVIYTEFTLQANVVSAAALSLILGIITWAALAVARSIAGSTVAAAG